MVNQPNSIHGYWILNDQYGDVPIKQAGHYLHKTAMLLVYLILLSGIRFTCKILKPVPIPIGVLYQTMIIYTRSVKSMDTPCLIGNG